MFDWSGGVVDVEIEFSHARGDIDLAVLSTGGDVIDSSLSTSDDERISIDLPRGSYVVLVEGYAGATGPYRLKID